MQFFRLSLEGCEHPFYESAVEFYGADDKGQPKPYAPDYTGKVLKCQTCWKVSKVTKQEQVAYIGA